ncbi:hypothetical protein D3C85_1917800 [compost metagenome]
MKANSIPMTPPPIIVMLFGNSVHASASVLFITKGRSMPGIFTLEILEPVATMMSFAEIW